MTGAFFAVCIYAWAILVENSCRRPVSVVVDYPLRVAGIAALGAIGQKLWEMLP